MLEINCPSCGAQGKMSLAQEAYQGPYRCWSCRSLFTLTIENKAVTGMEPLSQEEFDRWQEIQKLKQMRR